MTKPKRKRKDPSEPKPAEDTVYNSLLRLITVASLFLIILHVIGHFSPNRWLWGVYHSAVMPIEYALAAAILVTILVLPRVNSYVLGGYSGSIDNLAERMNRWRPSATIAVLSAALIVGALLLRTDNHLLGDGYTVLTNVAEKDIVSMTAPLTSALNLLLADLLQIETPNGAKSVFLISSVLAGIIFLIAARGFLMLAFRDAKKAVVGLLILFTTPIVQLFFGYVDNYPLLHAWIALFILVSTRTLRGHQRPIACLVVFLIGVGFHVSFLAFLPALLWVLVYSRERPGMRVFYISSAVFYGLMYFAGLTMSRREISFFLKPYPTSDSSYFLFSPEHFADLANLFLLTVPVLGVVFIAQIVLKAKGKERWDRAQQLLVLMSLSAVPFVFFVDPTIGAIRDWDLLSLAATPVAFSGTYFLLKKSSSTPRLAALTLPILALSLWHTGSWVYSNMDQQRASAVLMVPLLEDTHYTERYHGGTRLLPLSVIASNALDDDLLAEELAYRRLAIDTTDVVALDILQLIYRNNGNFNASADMLSRMVSLMPNDESYKLSYGITLARADRNLEASEILREIEPGSDNYARDYHLGSCYLGLEQYDSALACFNKIYADQPNSDLLNFNIGMAYGGKGDYATALEYLHKARAASPGNAEVFSQIGNVFQTVMLVDSAEYYYRRALNIDPGRFDVNSSLAFLYMNTGRPDESIRLWRRCIQLNPRFVEGYFFIGRIYNESGRPEEALETWNSALAIQPNFTPALYQSALLLEKLGQADSAEARLRRIAESDPMSAANDPEISAKLTQYGIEVR